MNKQSNILAPQKELSPANMDTILILSIIVLYDQEHTFGIYTLSNIYSHLLNSLSKTSNSIYFQIMKE